MTEKDLYNNNNYIKEVKAKHFNRKNLIKGGGKNKYMLYIYSPDCESCKQQCDLLTEYAILYPHYKIYAINCYDIKSMNDVLCANLNITRYPTLLYCKNDKLYHFKKNITSKSLEKFLMFN